MIFLKTSETEDFTFKKKIYKKLTLYKISTVKPDIYGLPALSTWPFKTGDFSRSTKASAECTCGLDVVN